jgi:O-antigen/teichoic acid export membrane protein
MGRFGYVIWLVGTVTSLVGFALPITTRRYVAEMLGSGAQDTALAVFKRSAGLGGGVFGLTGLVLVAYGLLVVPGEAGLYTLAATLVWLLGMWAIVEAAATGAQDFRTQALGTALFYALYLLLAGGTLALGLGLPGILSVWALATGVGLWFLGVRVWQRLSGGAEPQPLPHALRRRLLRFGTSLSLVLFLDVIVWRNSEVFFLKAYSSPQEIAYYAIAFGLAQAIPLMTSLFSSTILPVVSHLIGGGRTETVTAMFPQVLRYLALLGAPICFGGAAVVGQFIRLAYGSAYETAALLGTVLFLGGFLPALACGATAYLYGLDRPQFSLWLTGVAALLDVVLAWSLIPHLGAAGATIASVVSQTLLSVGLLACVTRQFGLSFPAEALCRIGFAGILTGGVALAVSRATGGIFGVVGAVLAGAVSYPLAILLVRAAMPADWRALSILGERLPLSIRTPYGQTLNVLSRVDALTARGRDKLA